MLEIQTTALTGWLKARTERLKEGASRAVLLAAEGAATFAKRTDKFKDRTGRLRKSIKAVQTSQYAARAIAGTNHAYYVENGNKPAGGFLIRPKKAKALRFKINGVTYFRKWVTPADPRKFMLEARNVAVPVFERFALIAAKDAFG